MKIIRSVIKLLEPYASTHGVKMTVKGRPLKIRGDKERLIEAFVNIIDNAIKYNKEGGRININITDKDRQAVVTVTDTGRGMPEGNKEKIFERFYRIETGAGAVQGSGLGLSIAKSIIEAHGGRIEVASKIGKGSSFIVYL
jgi:signal transduction histidine kinase